MPDPNALQELLTIHTRRLQELKKKQATYGLSADPSIALEIENIEADIKTLQTQLKGDCLEPSTKIENSATNGKRILVVEDNVGWQEILQEYLAEMGCQVEIAVDFSDARDKLQQASFHLVTIDAHLGVQARAHEGMLLLDYIRNRMGHELPIIIVSGEINKQDLVRAYQKFSVTSVLLKEHFECGEFQTAVLNAFSA